MAQGILDESIKSLLIEMKYNGTTLATGTAFIVTMQSGPVLITNRHNITGRHPSTDQPLSPTAGVPNEMLIHHNKKQLFGQWTEAVEPLYDDGNPLWHEHPTLGGKADFAALKLTNWDEAQIYHYIPSNPGHDILIGPTDSVSVIGFPFGFAAGGKFAIWVTGTVASEPDVDYNDLPILLIDCRSRKGQSGSPVIAFRSNGQYINSSGAHVSTNVPVCRFIGIYSRRLNEESDLGIVWKATAIQELIESIRW
ncbi:hypothetical protein D3C78_1028010 [compost metagenome]